MFEDEYWQAVLERDLKCVPLVLSSAYRVFVYGVISTKIYCRPSCPARKPCRKNVRFFPNCETAEKSGFRACLRCYPNQTTTEPHLELIKEICDAIPTVSSANAIQLDNPPKLEDLAQKFDLSLYHLQRTFKRIVGVTPHQYVEAQRIKRLKTNLKSGINVANALYEAGYNSSSNLYEKSATQLGMTPKKYQQAGKGINITYTIEISTLGYLLVGMTEKGICSVKLGDNIEELEHLLYQEFQQANIHRNDSAYRDWVQVILKFIAGNEPHLDLPLDIRGTAFQIQVWQALQKIPYGETRSYKEIASEIGIPNAVRAVGTACGANPVALIVPCHRVLRSDRSLGGYEWGLERKKKLLEIERKECN
jgi:AraC family transcriptional regulator, regulatory protein of adaptative response / methylated-DNA-[protein]-cysteine methyltransferase